MRWLTKIDLPIARSTNDAARLHEGGLRKSETITRHLKPTAHRPSALRKRDAFAREPVVRAFDYEQVCRRLYSSKVRVFRKSRRKPKLVA